MSCVGGRRVTVKRAARFPSLLLFAPLTVGSGFRILYFNPNSRSTFSLPDNLLAQLSVCTEAL
jgi:hypothetical protein